MPGSPFISGTNHYLTVDPLSRFVFAADEDPPGGVFAFTIGIAVVLTPVPGLPFPAESGAFAIAVNDAPGVNSAYVYVANQTANSIPGYSINATTGALTPLASSPFVASGVTALVTDSLDHLYVYGSGGMMVFSIDPNSGALAPIGSPIAFPGATVLTYVGGKVRRWRRGTIRTRRVRLAVGLGPVTDVAIKVYQAFCGDHIRKFAMSLFYPDSGEWREQARTFVPSPPPKNKSKQIVARVDPAPPPSTYR